MRFLFGMSLSNWFVIVIVPKLSADNLENNYTIASQYWKQSWNLVQFTKKIAGIEHFNNLSTLKNALKNAKMILL